MRPSHTPSAKASRPSGKQIATTVRKRAPRRGSGTPAHPLEQLRQIALVVLLGTGEARASHPGRPVERVDLEPGVVGEREPAGPAWAARDFRSAFSPSVSPVSSTSGP